MKNVKKPIEIQPEYDYTVMLEKLAHCYIDILRLNERGICIPCEMNF